MSASVLFPSITVLDPALSLFFIQIAIIWGLCRSLAMVGQYFHQPSVVFEIVGGILLGPSALGKYAPYRDAIIPEHSLEFLVLLANFGLQIYLFLVGLELELGILKSHSYTTALVAVFGLVIPFGFGLALSVLMYDSYAPEMNGTKTAFTTFSVFIGTALAVTALPVLARILKEKGLMFTKPGVIALGAAVITDAGGSNLTGQCELYRHRRLDLSGHHVLCSRGVHAGQVHPARAGAPSGNMEQQR